jgi:hypothetical protein
MTICFTILAAMWAVTMDCTLAFSCNGPQRTSLRLEMSSGGEPNVDWWDVNKPPRRATDYQPTPSRQLFAGDASSSNSLMAQGQKLIRMAIDADGQKQYQRAFNLYSEALGHLTKGVAQQDEERKRIYEQNMADIESYMNRAESLAQYLAAAEAEALASNSNPPAGSQSSNPYDSNNSHNRQTPTLPTTNAQQVPSYYAAPYTSSREANPYVRQPTPPKVKSNPYAASSNGPTQQRPDAAQNGSPPFTTKPMPNSVKENPYAEGGGGNGNTDQKSPRNPNNGDVGPIRPF